MLRLLGFFLLAFLLLQVLQELPFIGGLFHNIFAFWLVAILLSAALSRLSRNAVDRRRLDRMRRSFEAVDNPHNQGKLGALLIGQKRYGKAIPYLEQAVAGDPDFLEWRYRLGQARIGLRMVNEALEPLLEVARRDEEYHYGAVQLRLAEAFTLAGRSDEAIACLEVFERNHGENPESAYRKGRALKVAGRRDDAQRSFQHVGELARSGARYQKSQNRDWVWRALLARFV